MTARWFAEMWQAPSIRSRLRLLSLSVLLITVMLVFVVMQEQQRRLLQQETTESVTAQARLMAINSQAALAFRDRREAGRLLAAVESNPAVLRARLLVGSSDRVFAQYVRGSHVAVSNWPIPPLGDGWRVDNRLLTVWAPVPGQEIEPATVELTVSLDGMRRSLERSAFESALVVLLGLLVTLGLSNWLARRLTAPLEKLGNLVTRVAANPGLTDRVAVDGFDEIAQLAHGVNGMLDTLRTRDQELAQYRENLEQLVLQRTRELERAVEAARSADRAKGDFLARMSHEIRTPMNAVVGLSRYLLDTPLTPSQRDYQEKVIGAAETLLRLIDDILDFARIEAGKLSIESIAFDLKRLTENVQAQLEVRAREKGLRFTVDMEASVPQMLVGDPLRLSQILLNLAGNAVKFTTQGEVSVRFMLGTQPPEDSDSNGVLPLRVEVSDTGPGMSAETLAHLFSPFEQFDGSITRQHGGSGLGLAICKQLVELMGGVIGVDSAPGRGSRFWLELPLRRTPPEAAAAVGPSEIPDFGAIAGARVLLVDDVRLNREVALAFLRRTGVDVEVAASGSEALAKLQEMPFDLVLMDVQMPDQDGWSVTRQIRADPRLHDLPVIAMTAHAMPADRVRSREAGMNDHLNKPIVPAQLYDALLRWIPPRQGGSDAEATPQRAVRNEPDTAAAPGDSWLNVLQESGIDPAVGMGYHMNDALFYQENLHAFVEEFANAMDTVRNALRVGDRDSAARMAHSLKSAAATIGAMEVATLSAQLEQDLVAGRDGEPAAAECEQRLQRLAQGITPVMSRLPAGH